MLFICQHRQSSKQNKILVKMLIHFVSVLLFISASSAFAQNGMVEFNINKQALSTALTQFAEQSELQIMFRVEELPNLKVDGLQGRYTPEQALSRLLDNTELEYVFGANDNNIVVVRRVMEDVAETEAASSRLYIPTANEVGKDELLQLAQAGDPPSSTTSYEAPAPAIEEVTVTAQLREQSLQEIPVSVSAFSGELLDSAGISTAHDIARFTPGFTATEFTAGDPTFVLRGASNTFTAAAANKPVGFFLDDVYISRNSGAAFDLFDLEQVTVLRGPQGTLSGRNVTGGAVMVTTAKPSLEEFDAKMEAGYGNYDFIQARGLVNGPLSDSIAAKASFSYKNRDGYGSDPLLNGRDTDDLDSLNVRGQLLFAPSDKLEILATLSYSKDENNNRTLSNTEAGIDDGDIRTTEVGVPQTYDREVFGASLHIDWDIGAGTVKSITAYRESDSTDLFARVGAHISQLSTFTATGGLAFDDISTDMEEPKTFSQELRFVSEEYEHYNYVLGVYYFHDDVDRTLGRTREVPTGSFATFLRQDNLFVQTATTESIALYTDIQVHFSDTLDINFGGRYTYENKEASEDFINNLNATQNFSAAAERSWNSFTPRVALSWHPTDDLTLFASYTEGFTSGGFFTEATTLTGFNTPYEEEEVTNIEVGIKAQWLDRALTTNITAFTSDYKDKQEIFFTGATIAPIFTVVTANAGKASIEGVEAELGWAVTDDLNVNATYAYLNARYDTFIAGTNGDLSGNFLGKAPKHSASVYADYTYDMGSSGRLLLNGSYTWTDSYFGGAGNVPVESVSAYGLFNGTLTYEAPDKHWRASLWAQNIADTEYRLLGSAFNTTSAYFGAPRTYGIRVSYDF
jgi:iron complex outermembrane recepter protein